MANSDGLTHISTVSLTGAANTNVDSIFDSTYDNYRIMLYVDAASTNAVASRLRVGGSPNSTANSYQFQYYFSASTTRSGLRNTSTDFDVISVDTARNSIAVIDLVNVALAEPTMIMVSQFRGDGNAAQIYYATRHNQNVAYDGLSFGFVTAPTLATIDIFGWTKG